jgi:LmbE family N-acetylglucosaminyl deacetylase
MTSAARGKLAGAGHTILAVFAHPDDESLSCGGTLARLSDMGARVVLVGASRGERGSHTGPARDEALGLARVLELRQAAAALGVAEVIVLDHPDGDLRWAEVTALHAELLMLLRHHQPSAVITFGEDGLYWHPDHVAIHERTTTAVRSLGAAAPPLYYVTMPPGVMHNIVAAAREKGWTPPPKGFWSLAPRAFGIHAEPPTIVVDVGRWVPRKLLALRCYRSQLGDGDPFSRLDERDAQAWLGIEHFRRAPTAGRSDPVFDSLGSSFAANHGAWEP